MRSLPLVVIALLAAGCGTAQHVATPGTTRQAERLCSAAKARGFRTCWSGGPVAKPTIERRTASGWRVIARSLAPPEPSAQWGEVLLSPDGRTLLAEWRYPCDSAAAVFLPAGGGKPRLVTGERDWRKAPVSRALGWTRDGKARVRLYTSWRRWRISTRRPRVFLFDPQVPARDARPAAQSGC